MNKLMVDVSLAVATHTSNGVRELLAASPGRSVHLVHSPRYPDLPVQEDLLRRFHLEDAWPVLASFGFVTPEKRIVACLKAVRKLWARFPRIRYMIVGANPEHFDPNPVIRKLRLKDAVTLTGRVDEATFGSLLHAATIVLNLRYPTAREMSATLLRALGAGRVTLVSEQLHLTDIPADIAPRVPLFDEDEAIARIVQDLLADEVALRERGRRAREFVDSVHGIESVGSEYETAIAAALEAKPLFRPPAGIPEHLRPLAARIRSSLPSGHGIDLMSLFD
jgi:glycosyltransferase involved in cell wall biosynthesis